MATRGRQVGPQRDSDEALEAEYDVLLWPESGPESRDPPTTPMQESRDPTTTPMPDDDASAAGEEPGLESTSLLARVNTVVRSRAGSLQQFFIGDEDTAEHLLDPFQAPVTITMPRWALWSILGVGALVVWRHVTLQGRRHEELVSLLHKFVEHSQEVQRLTQDHALQQASLAEQRADKQLYSGLAAGMAAFALPLLIFASDVRLKQNLRRTGATLGNCPVYVWDWNEEAQEQLGLCGCSQGVLAQDVLKIQPHAACRLSDGYIRVAYRLLMTPEL